MKQIDLREGARRQHRSVALFAVVQCWLRNLDGLVFDREHLDRLVGLRQFKGARVDWLLEDFREFFQHVEIFRYESKKKSFDALYVSRCELTGWLPNGTMTDEKRLANIASGGPKLEMFKIWPQSSAAIVVEEFEAAAPFFADAANYDERLLSSYLALLGQGQISPWALPSLQKDT